MWRVYSILLLQIPFASLVRLYKKKNGKGAREREREEKEDVTYPAEHSPG